MTAPTRPATCIPVAHRSWRRSPLVGATADLLRVGAGASFAWAVLDSQWVNAALFALVWGGLMLSRALATSPALDLLCGVVVLFAAWSAVLDLYLRYAGLDLVVHGVTCGVIAALVHRVLAPWSVRARADRARRRAQVGAALTVVALGCALGLLWEVGEWWGHTYLDDRIQVGYHDTLADLVADGLGALVTGALVASSARTGAR